MFAKRVKLSHRVSTDLNEGLAGFFAQSWVDVRSRVRDVVLQHSHVQELFLHLLLGLVVERHQVVSQPAVVSLILGIQHQENEVESDGATNTKLRLVCNTATCGSVHREFQCSDVHLDRRVWGSWMFSIVVFLGFHWDSTGLAAASTAVRAFSWQMIPAWGHENTNAVRPKAPSVCVLPNDYVLNVVTYTFAMERVCCSMTSCSTERVLSLILSNSSMQQMPLSLRTSAPVCSTSCLVSGSFIT